MRSVAVYLYDAFASHVFGGNIAGVVIEPGVDGATMQKLAAELPVPTTGFVSRAADGSWDLRFFTPTQEINMCGHVVVGTFSALVDRGLLAAGTGTTAVARTKAGPIGVSITSRGERPLVEMQLNRPDFRFVPLGQKQAAEMLGISVTDLHPTLPLAIVSTAISHLVIPTAGVHVLGNLAPDNAGLARLSRSLGVDTIPVIACDGLPEGVHLRSRDLCPGIGNAEEAASGTTNGALACYMAVQGLVRPTGDGVIRLTAQQGVEMGRPSIIESELRVRGGGEISEVRVRGQAVRSFEGTAFIP